MNLISNPTALKVFYGVAACSWMPHWSCHYYRLETNSDFIVGSWAFSSTDSVYALLVYGLFVALNLVAIQNDNYRIVAAALTGAGHLALGSLHVYRFLYPFKFSVFGFSWSTGASMREVLVVVPFGFLSLVLAAGLMRKQSSI